MLLAIFIGCDQLPLTTPAKGVVYFEDKPLEFGSVMFQPINGGQPARGDIQSDGTYVLSTFADQDGAIIGKHQVRIMCNSAQDPNSTEEIDMNAATIGRVLIPRKYTQLSSSGFSADVLPEGNEPFEFRLYKD